MKGGLLKSPSSAGRPKPGQSNIRGKISGPIPIHHSAEDDEFPIRERGTGHATPLGSEGPNRLAPPPERGSVIDSQSTNGQARVSPEERTPSRTQLGTSQASENSGSPAQQRTTRSSTLRYSTVSNNTDSEREAPQRKKSTLRNALSKLFGRKKKSASSGGSLETHHEDPSETALQRSEPSSLSRGARTKEGEPKRSVSLPITEFDRALRSHSVGPEDISAIESVRNSLQVEPMRYRKRAATTTSRLFNTKSRDFGELQQGLSPRPASAQGRGNQEITDDDPSNIGRAITSDILTLHRRSRSLSQLPDDGSHLQRRRSDEIRYWRESYNPGLLSPTSSNANEDNEVLSVDRPESPAKPNPMTPPQPFNFGPVAGMKITQAVTIEERITNLETSNQKLEKLVYQLFQLLPGVNEYPATTERPSHSAPRPYSSAYSTSSVAANRARENVSRDSNDSFGDENTFIGSIPPSSGLANRPVSTATVRGATSLPTIPRDLSGQFTPDHYTTLLAIIETERSARQALEAQVHKLSTQLQLLSRASQKDACTTGPVYSTFEHDDEEEEEAQVAAVDDEMSGSEAFKTPNEEYSQHGFGAFGEELTDEESDGRRKRAARTLSLSQLTLKKPAKPSKSSKKHPETGVNL